MKLSKEIVINAPAEKVWNILANRFADAGVWARSISHSVANHEIPKVNNSPIGGRLCDTTVGTGKISEEFTFYDEEKMTFSFKSAAPSSMFDNVVSTNTVTAIDENTSKVTVTHSIDLKMLGFLTHSLIRVSLHKSIKDVLSDLKYFAENDKPSQKKIALQK